MSTIFLVLTFVLLALVFLKLDAIVASKKFQFPDKGQYLKIKHFNIFYKQMGTGKNIILLHGLGASLDVWKDTALILSKNYRVTLIDLPGFGRSTKSRHQNYGLDEQTERLVNIIDKLQINEATLVGSSMGGTLALWTTQKFPVRFKKIVAIGPATNPKLVPLPVFKVPGLSILAVLLTNRIVMGYSIRHVLYNRPIDLSRRILLALKNYQPEFASMYVLLKASKLIADKRLPQQLEKIQSVSLVLWGEEDRVIPRMYIDELKSILPKASFFSHPEGGHHLMEDQPKWVSSKIIEFLQGH